MPDADGKWAFRMTDKIAVRFQQDSSGKITGMTHFQNGKEVLMPRIADAGAAANVPSVESIMALHERGCGSDSVSAAGNIRMTARMRMIHQGLNDIRMTVLAAGSDRFMQHNDMGKFGWIKIGLDGKSAWQDSIFQAGKESSQEEAKAMRLQNPMLPVLDWRTVFDKVEVTKLDTIDDRSVVVLELTTADKVRCTAYVDQENGRPLRFDYQVPMPTVGNISTSERLLDWRETDGMYLPYRWEIDSDIYGKTIVEIEKVETKVDLPADAFKMPKR